jgi:hypothetical protein
MPRIRKLLLFALIPLVINFVPGAARAEKRVALVTSATPAIKPEH